MKIGILTQPLCSNYGGLLQAWALQRILVKLGHDVEILNRSSVRKPSPLWRRRMAKVKHELLIALGKTRRYVTVTEELKQFSEQNVRKFRDNCYLGVSPVLNSEEELHDYVTSQNFDAFVVGSDQVWRPIYSPNLMTYFLDFVKDDNTVKKIAYAASFGVDNWEFSEEQTKTAAELAPLFDVITVRESSGVKLVEHFLKCNATHVLDPTMLLNKEDYIGLVEAPTCPLNDSNGELFCYVLDKTSELKEIIGICSAKIGLKPYYCNYKTPLSQLEDRDKFDECIVPPVEQWLKSFSDAQMVVTDSFHGMVFSIIFNRPFWVMVNTGRGSARFSSILKQFGLEGRIVADPYKIDWGAPIDWDKINAIRSILAEFSKSILISALK